MGNRKRIVRRVVEDTRAPRTTLKTVDERLREKYAEYLRMTSVSKQVGIAKAYNEAQMKVRNALVDKGVKFICP